MATSQKQDEKQYVLGTDVDETARLGLQHRLWSEATHALWERAGLRPGHIALDLGCGPGYAAFDMAMIVGGVFQGTPAGRVIAVDESARFLSQLSAAARSRGLTNVDAVLADAQTLDQTPSLRPASFDLAYARWLFCFLKEPGAVVRQLARLVKAGGRVAIQDYFNYESMCVARGSAAYQRAVHATAKSWRDHGGDPDIMARMPAILSEHGFEVVDLQVRQRIARPGSMLWAWPDMWWKTYVPKLIEMGYLTRDEGAAFFSEWDATTRNPNAFAVVPPVFELIAVKK